MNTYLTPVTRLILLIGVFLFSTPELQASTKERIINGTATTQDWPWMASLGSTGVLPSRGHFCGAVIIDSKYAVTAAHCMEGLTSNPSDLQLYIGKSNFNDANAKVIVAEGIIVHPDYDPETEQNDIALIRLSEEVDASSILPVLTPEEEALLPAGINTLLLGWGTTDPKLTVRPQILQQALLPLIDAAQCQARIGIDFDAPTMLCAGSLSTAAEKSDGVDSCYGDSGGPLMVETAGGWRLVGLASWGLACASEKYWGVYTRVPTYAQWIRTARTVPPFLINPPEVTGAPRVNSKLSCQKGVYGGDVAQITSVNFLDGETGEILKKGGSYELKKSDVGRNIRCEVNMVNSGGEISAQSEPVGPIFPQTFSSSLRVSRASIVSKAGINCTGSRCKMLMLFKKPISSLRALLEPSRLCRSGQCRDESWKKATKLTSTAWSLSVPKNRRSYKGVLVRSMGVDKKSVLSEILF